MVDGAGQTDWLEVLAAEDRDAFRAQLVPADDEPWEQVLVKHQRAREWFGSDKVMAVTPTGISAYHGMMINLAIGRGELAYALATFDEMGTVAAPRTDDPRVREIACRAGGELMQALVEAADQRAAEHILAILDQLATAYPDDADVVSTAAAAASYLVVGHCRRKDFESALACCNRINHLYGNEELRPEIDLWHARSVVNLILALVESDAWNEARHIAHQRRELLLSPASLEDLAATRGEEPAASIRELLDAMIETYEATHPSAAPRGRDKILDQYDFDRLQAVSPFQFLSLRVPARWSYLQHENGDWGYWEEGVEAGTLWVNDQYLDLDAGPHGPSRDLLDQIVGDIAEGIVSDAAGDGRRITDVQTAGTTNGRLIRYRREGEEDGEQLAYHQWFLLCPCGTGALLIQFSLVLLLDLADRPDFKALVEIMDREIGNARIDPSRIPTGG